MSHSISLHHIIVVKIFLNTVTFAQVKAFDWLRNGPKFLERVFDYGAGVHPFTNGWCLIGFFISMY